MRWSIALVLVGCAGSPPAAPPSPAPTHEASCSETAAHLATLHHADADAERDLTAVYARTCEEHFWDDDGHACLGKARTLADLAPCHLAPAVTCAELAAHGKGLCLQSCKAPAEDCDQTCAWTADHVAADCRERNLSFEERRCIMEAQVAEDLTRCE